MTRTPAAETLAEHPLFYRLSGLTGTSLVLLLGWLVLSALPAETAAPARGCAGYLRGQIYGALDMDLDWSGEKLSCAGMSRPDGQGIRLHFAWDQGDGERLVLVMGMDGTAAAITGQEKPANVTFIDERSGRFYSSGGAGRCWTDIVRLTELPASSHQHPLQGRLYCTATLPALNDRSSLTLGDLHYYGHFAFDDQ